jgi:hypothetical protein
MSKFAVIRLGKDSVKDIKRIDSIHGRVTVPLELMVRCSQVPTELRVGDYAFLCLGSDNNSGLPTAWVRGMRALGTITSKAGGATYNAQSEIGVEIKVVLPESVTRKLLLKKAPTAYIDFSDIPVLGVDTHSNQTIQLIKASESDQNVSALLFGLNQLFPGFREEAVFAYPALDSMFDYVPLGVHGRPDDMLMGGKVPSSMDLANIVERFVQDAQECSLRVTLTEARRFLACLLAKRFLIATGLSGSGKTKLAQAVARWLSPANQFAKRAAIVSVGADWTGNENVVGYPNGLDQSSYIGKPALRVILEAMADPDQPYFLILDEMNLSHVERYFADILSALESDEAVSLHSDAERLFDGIPVPQSAPLPKNLFIIGTVNVDETTYMFSPKVLDRANVIEFRMSHEDMQEFLRSAVKPDMSALAGRGAQFGESLVAAATGAHAGLSTELQKAFNEEFLLFFKILQEDGAEFGYRVALESARFVSFFESLGEEYADLSELHAAVDFLILQKLLPKLHGSRTKLGPLLKKLWLVCVTPFGERIDDFAAYVALASNGLNKSIEPSTDVGVTAPYPHSAEKVARMWRQLNENGFASFAEA